MNYERIANIIKDIEKFFADLHKSNVKNLKQLENKEKFYAVSMMLFSIINRAIDMGEEIVSDKKLGFPSKYREIFYLLEKNKIIDKKLSVDLASLIHFRNLAAHEYQTFKEKDVFEALEKIESVNKFIKAVKQLYGLERKNNKK